MLSSVRKFYIYSSRFVSAKTLVKLRASLLAEGSPATKEAVDVVDAALAKVSETGLLIRMSDLCVRRSASRFNYRDGAKVAAFKVKSCVKELTSLLADWGASMPPELHRDLTKVLSLLSSHC